MYSAVTIIEVQHNSCKFSTAQRTPESSIKLQSGVCRNLGLLREAFAFSFDESLIKIIIQRSTHLSTLNCVNRSLHELRPEVRVVHLERSIVPRISKASPSILYCQRANKRNGMPPIVQFRGACLSKISLFVAMSWWQQSPSPITHSSWSYAPGSALKTLMYRPGTL